MKKIALLGSTGSIGTQTLEIVRRQEDLQVTALAAGSNAALLEQQIREFLPEFAVLWDENHPYSRVSRAAPSIPPTAPSTDFFGLNSGGTVLLAGLFAVSLMGLYELYRVFHIEKSVLGMTTLLNIRIQLGNIADYTNAHVIFFCRFNTIFHIIAKQFH